LVHSSKQNWAKDQKKYRFLLRLAALVPGHGPVWVKGLVASYKLV
jgi:hypothetical protein